jgi:hypothetical protein
MSRRTNAIAADFDGATRKPPVQRHKASISRARWGRTTHNSATRFHYGVTVRVRASLALIRVTLYHRVFTDFCLLPTIRPLADTLS